MRWLFDWVREKNGWQILIIEGRQTDVKIELMMTEEEALNLYKFIGDNFPVERLET